MQSIIIYNILDVWGYPLIYLYFTYYIILLGILVIP